MSQFNRLVAIFAALLSSGAACAENVPYMVRDVEGDLPRLSSGPANFMPLGDGFVFQAGTPEAGRSLWVSDGTEEGTSLLRSALDVDGLLYVYRAFGHLNGSVYFRAKTDPFEETWDIWATDGTPSGTRIILDVDAPDNTTPTPLIEFDGRLYFRAGRMDGATLTYPIWVTDGTEGSTTVFFPNSGLPLASVNGKLLFAADTSNTGGELWVTDGTPEGTSQLPEIYPGPSSGFGSALTVMNGYFYFLGQDSAHGLELWRSDGTAAGTNLVRDIQPGTQSPFPFTPGVAVMGGVLYFVATEGQYGRELWRSDGTEAGTHVAVDFLPGPQTGTYDGAIGATLDRVFFQIVSGASRGVAATDGTAEGTVVVVPSGVDILRSIHTTSTLAFIKMSNRFLVRSDGTLEGTFSLPLREVFHVTSIGERVVMEAEDFAHGEEPWLSDGSVEGTRLVADVAHIAGGDPTDLVDVNGQLFFSSNDPEVGIEPVRTRGTAKSTQLVADLRPGSSSSFPRSFVTIENGVIFLAGGGGGKPWRTDPETGDTILIESAPPLNLLFPFTLNQFAYGLGGDLWRTDGTNSYLVASYPFYPLATLGSQLILRGATAETGQALWLSDGTSPGTPIDIPPGPTDFGTISFLGATTDRVYYFVTAAANRIWSTDGTEPGTTPVPGTSNFLENLPPLPSAALNGTLYFAGVRGTQNLYAIDEPDASPRVVLSDVFISDLAVLGDRLFIIDTHAIPSTLWISDGTAEGTEVVPGVTPDPDAYPQPTLVVMDDAIYFAAWDSTHGAELWRSRGTAESTEMVADINPGQASSNPARLTASGDRLYFSANDGVHGTELWALVRDVRGDIDGDGDADLQDLSYLLANFGGDGPTGDLDGDGDVDLQDLGYLLANFGDSVGP